jgi:hypothetical protein
MLSVSLVSVSVDAKVAWSIPAPGLSKMYGQRLLTKAWDPSETTVGLDVKNRRSDYCELRLPELTKSLAHILSVSTSCISTNWFVLRYRQGDFVKRHDDYFPGACSRLWTCIVHLNDIKAEDGGATMFPEPSNRPPVTLCCSGVPRSTQKTDWLSPT